MRMVVIKLALRRWCYSDIDGSGDDGGSGDINDIVGAYFLLLIKECYMNAYIFKRFNTVNQDMTLTIVF